MVVGGQVSSLTQSHMDDKFSLANRLDHDSYLEFASTKNTNNLVYYPVDALGDPNWLLNHWMMHISLNTITGAPMPYGLEPVDTSDESAVARWMSNHQETHQLIDQYFEGL